MLQEGHAGKEICIGYDRRFLSKESAHWAAEVLAGYGFPVFVVSRSSPTPLIMFAVKQMACPYGMAVTASHNPAIYNGIKIFTEGGRDAEREVTNRIEAQIAQLQPADVQSMDYQTALEQGIIREGYPFNDYIDSILDRYGETFYVEEDFTMTQARKQQLQEAIFVNHRFPDFTGAIERIDRSDGCKIWFADGSWVICRFSGTEPLLRMAAEGQTEEQARRHIRYWKEFLAL